MNTSRSGMVSRADVCALWPSLDEKTSSEPVILLWWALAIMIGLFVALAFLAAPIAMPLFERVWLEKK